MPSPIATPTPITPPRVPIIDQRTGLIDRAWYMYFLSLYNAAQAADATPLNPSAESLIASNEALIGALAQYAETLPAPIDYSDDIAKVKSEGGLAPSSLSAELQQEVNTLRQEVEVLPRQELGTMSQLQQAWLPWVTFDNAPEVTPPDVGTVAWDGGTTLGVQMTTNVLGRVNESGYYYIKASSAITKGDVVMFTGAVGASGVPTGAPATGVTDGSYIMGIAAESIALNGFGLVQFIGTLRGVNLSAYSDGDILWYNPAVTGGLTKTKPSAPNVKVQMAAVISNANNGTMLVRVTAGSELGGTDSNVLFGTLSNGDLIQYDSTAGYWKNIPGSTYGTGSVTSVAALTLGTTGTDLSSTVANPTTTPVITLNVPTASATNRGALSSTDWSTFNSKQSVAAPVTKTADFSVAATDLWLINNKSGSTCTVTLPAASSNSGRVLHFLNYQAYTVVSASSNVVPLVGGAAGTAILAAVAGDTATLVSDGTNWIMTQYTPNNVLLLE